MTYTPHKWSYNRSNGFWANCTCGYSASGFFDSIGWLPGVYNTPDAALNAARNVGGQ